MQPKASCPWSLKTTPWSLNLTCFVAILYWVSQTFSREVKCCALLSPLLLSPPPRLSRPPRRLWEWASTPRLVHAAKCVLQNLACSFCLWRFDRAFATPSNWSARPQTAELSQGRRSCLGWAQQRWALGKESKSNQNVRSAAAECRQGVKSLDGLC